ncbi:MAG: DMT family transporter [Acidimicrobiia bacterium]
MFARSPVVAAVSLAVLAVAWGAIPLFVRNDVPSTALVGARVTFGAIALITAAAATRRLVWPSGRLWRLALSGVLLALHWVTFFESIKHASVAVALAVLYVGPIVASILAGPLLGESVSGRLWLALSVAMAGTILVVQPWSATDEGAVTTRGLVMAVASAAFLAALLLVGKPVAKRLGGLTMAIGELTVASLILAPATVNALTEYRGYWLSFIVLGALFTGLAGYVYWDAMQALPLAAVSVIMYLEPASAVVWAAVFLAEVPGPLTWVGVALVVAGGAVAGYTSNEERVISAPVTL